MKIENQPSDLQLIALCQAPATVESVEDEILEEGPTVVSLEEYRLQLGREKILQRLFDSGLLHLKMS